MKRIAVCILLIVIFLLTTASAEGTILTVSGSGVVSVPADQVRIVLGVQDSSADVLEVQAQVNGKINAIYNALIAAGVEKKNIGTESIYIYANYDYSEDMPRLTGYTASNTISITTSEIDKSGEYIDIAFCSGANTLDSLDFSAKNTQDAQAEALTLAVQNAFEKAQIIAEAAGLEISGVKSMDETAEYYGASTGAKYSNMRTEGAAVDSSTTVQASSLQVEATIKVEFELSKGES